MNEQFGLYNPASTNKTIYQLTVPGFAQSQGVFRDILSRHGLTLYLDGYPNACVCIKSTLHYISRKQRKAAKWQSRLGIT